MTLLSETAPEILAENSPEAALALGQLLLDTGQPLAAIDCLKQAARGGNGTAMNMLGRINELGWGVVPDPVAAAAYYSRACDIGEPWAFYHLGDLFLAGNGVPQSDADAHRLYTAAAATGHAKATNMLGMMAEDHRGPEGPDQAKAYYLTAAEAGDCWAQFNAARLLIAEQQIEAGLEWIDRSLADGTPEYLRVILEALIEHPDERVKKRAIWAETLLKRHFEEQV